MGIAEQIGEPEPPLTWDLESLFSGGGPITASIAYSPGIWSMSELIIWAYGWVPDGNSPGCI